MLYQDLEEVAGKISLSVNPDGVWVDEKLTWDPRVYGGIDTILLTLKDIWYPKLDLLNPYSNNIIYNPDDVIRVYSTGLMVMGKITIYDATCSINVQFYPFDTQVSEQMFIYNIIHNHLSLDNTHSIISLTN